MVQVAEKLSILKMTSEERANYSYYQKKLYSDRDELAAAEARGIEKEKHLIAKKMLESNTEVKFISAVTGLSTDEILKIQHKL